MFLFMLQYQFTIRVLWLVLSIFISFMVKTFTLSCGPVVQTSTPSFTVIVLVKRREIYPHIYIYIFPLLRNLYHFIQVWVNPFAARPSMKFESETLSSIVFISNQMI